MATLADLDDIQEAEKPAEDQLDLFHMEPI